MLQPQLHRMAQYNYWANQKITRFILAAGTAKANQEQVSSFPTIAKTLFHIWDAELVWHKRLMGEVLPAWPPSGDFKGSLDQAIEAFLLNSKHYIDYTLIIREENLADHVAYTNSANKPFSTSIADILTHCFNHSTYHRGQLITMLRHVGFTEVSSLDFITWCRIG